MKNYAGSTPNEIGASRRDGSDTMLAGAMAVAPQLSTIRRRVLDLFLKYKRLTDEELVQAYAALWGDCLYRSIGTRRRELVMRGAVRDSGDRKKSGADVNVIVWELTEGSGGGKERPVAVA